MKASEMTFDDFLQHLTDENLNVLDFLAIWEEEIFELFETGSTTVLVGEKTFTISLNFSKD